MPYAQALNQAKQIRKPALSHSSEDHKINAEQNTLNTLKILFGNKAKAYFRLLENCGLLPLLVHNLGKEPTIHHEQVLKALNEVLQQFCLRKAERWQIQSQHFWDGYQAKLDEEFKMRNLPNRKINVHKRWGTLYILCSRRPLDVKLEAEAIIAMRSAGYKVFDEYNMMRFYTQKARSRNKHF